MLEIVLNPDRTIQIPLVGTCVTYQGEEYVVLQTMTYQEQDPNNILNVVFGTLVTLLAIDAEGEDLGKPTIKVNSDEVTEI